MRHALRLTALAALTAFATASSALAQRPVDKLDVRLKLALAGSGSAAAETARPQSMIDVFIIGDAVEITRAVRESGGVVRTVAGSIVTAHVPERSVMTIASVGSVRRIQAAAPMRRFNDAAARAVAADRVWTAPPPGESAYTGKGVIVGIVDTGIDWTHPDFRDPADANRSRILRIWDQNDSLGAGAGTYDYGTEWTKEQIDAALLAHDTSAVRHRDNEGHGTHVSGTAAGNGLAVGRHRGMAYDADIAVVALNWSSSTSLVDAAAYLFNLGRELGRPVVINMSLGSIESARDGSDAVDQALDALLAESSGRVACIAAGNLGDAKGHWGASLSGAPAWSYVMYDSTQWIPDASMGLSIVLKAVVATSAIDSTMIAVGVDSLAHADNGILPVATDTTAWQSIADIVASQSPALLPLTYRNGGAAGQAMFAAAPEGEDHYAIYVIITDVVAENFTTVDPLSNGVDFFRLLFKGTSDVHVWTAMGLAVDGSSLATTPGAGYRDWDNGYSVTSPGTAHSVLTVGASSNVAQFVNYEGQTVPLPRAGVPGELAEFSSVGPSFDGRLKPEIVAPGHGVTSALATNLRSMWLAAPESPVVFGGYHAIFSGTSMATPVVTGAVALYLERNPGATYAQVKNAITSTARRDEQTSSFGPLPNVHWGYGKLDIYHAIYGATASSDEVSDRRAVTLEQSVPNPASSTATIAFTLDERCEARLEIVDMNGTVRAVPIDGMLDAGAHDVKIDAATLTPGVYTYRLKAGGSMRCGRMTVVR
jgi:subtilisin family serine protease